MSKPHRDKLKRQLIKCHSNLEVSYEPLMILFGEFDVAHPEYAQGIANVVELISNAQQVLETFGAVAWNMKKDDFNHTQ